MSRHLTERTMRGPSSPRDKRIREASIPLAISGPSGSQNRLPSLREAIPEIRSTNLDRRDYSAYARELHHDPPGPDRRYPTTPTIGPSPPSSRSRLPPSSGSSSNDRPGNSHRQDYYDRARIQPEMQLPMHSGPPSRNSGSPSSSSPYSDSRSIISSATAGPRVRTPERGPPLNGRSPGSGSLPPIYTITQSASSGVPSQLPPINPIVRPPMGNGYSQPVPPEALHMDPRYSYANYAHHPHDPHTHMGRPVEFQNVEVGEKSNKKRRGNLPKQTTDVLRAWLHDHLDHAYPNEEQKQQLIRETNLTDKQVSNWFINARRRNMPRLLRQAEQESDFKAGRASSSRSPPEEHSPGRNKAK
ncbi:MAG: hypothetical protein Q9216_003482 [Gyalolechia sp. 2 TL-2023]